MKKIKVYAISKCSLGASEEDFANNLCTFVCKKKQITEYILNKIIIDNYDHFTSWLTIHGKKDDGNTRIEYIALMSEEGKSPVEQFTVKITYYTPESLAAILRTYNGCVPIGSSFDTKLEIDQYLSYAKEVLNKVKNKTVEQ